MASTLTQTLYMNCNGQIIPLWNVAGYTCVDCPRNLAFSKEGSLFATSFTKQCLYKLDTNGEVVSTIDTGSYCDHLSLQSNVVHTSDSNSGKVLKYDINTGEKLGTIQHKKKPSSDKFHPSGLSCAVNGDLHLQDFEGFIHVYDAKGIHLSTTVYKAGLRSSTINRHGRLHVCAGSSVIVIKENGEYSTFYKDGDRRSLVNIVFNEDGFLLGTTGVYRALLVISPSGHLVYEFQGFQDITGIAIDPLGYVWVADRWIKAILKLPPVLPNPLSVPRTLFSQCQETVILNLPELQLSLLPPRLAHQFDDWKHPVKLILKGENSIDTFEIKLKDQLLVSIVEWIVSKKTGVTIPPYQLRSTIPSLQVYRLSDVTKEWDPSYSEIEIYNSCI